MGTPKSGGAFGMIASAGKQFWSGLVKVGTGGWADRFGFEDDVDRIAEEGEEGKEGKDGDDDDDEPSLGHLHTDVKEKVGV